MSKKKRKTTRVRSIPERKRKADIVFSAVFCLIAAAVSAGMILMERPTVSETENRTLEEMPEFSSESYFSGEFAAQLDRYFTDTVPFRDKLNELASVLEKAKGISAPKFYGAVTAVNDPDMTETETEPTITEMTFPEETEPVSEEAVTEVPVSVTEEAETTVTVPSETSAAETTASNQGPEFLNNGILVDGVKMYGEKAGIMLFGGNKTQGTRYAQLISSYKRALGDDVNVYNLVVPTSVEFYLPEKYSRYSNSEKNAIDNIYANLTDGVIPVDAYSVLEEHKDEYIYFRTDHHWSPLGAYYAYTAFCSAIGQEAPTLDSYTMKTKSEPYVGSLYGYTNDITIKNNPDTFTYYLPNAEYTGYTYDYSTLKLKGVNPVFHEYASGGGMYGMFLGGDALHVKITSNAGTGRKIVMFKESYGNAFAPYLVNSFDEIYVIDIRYFGKNAVEYIKSVGATDVLFIDNIFAANTSSLINGIERLYSSKTGTIVVTAPPETKPAETSSGEKTKKTTAKKKKTDAASTEKKPATTEVPEEKTEKTTVNNENNQ